MTGDLQQEVGDRCEVEGGAVTGAVTPHVRYGHTVTLATLGRERKVRLFVVFVWDVITIYDQTGLLNLCWLGFRSYFGFKSVVIC